MKYSKHKSISFSDHKKYSNLTEYHSKTGLKLKKKSLKGAYWEVIMPKEEQADEVLSKTEQKIRSHSIIDSILSNCSK